MVLKPMLAKDGKCSDAKDESKIKQIKFDGTRTFLLKDDNKIRLMGARNWKNDYAKNHPDLVAEAKKIPAEHAVLDCELTYFKKGTQKDVFLTALATKKTMEKEGVEPKLMCFDILELGKANVQKLPFKERDKLLEHTIPKLDLIKKVESRTDGEKLLDETRRNEQEGIVVKDPDCRYIQDTRSKCMLKVKNWLSDEAVVVGYTQGLGAKKPTFGAVVLAQYDKDKQLQYVGKAAGFTVQGTKEMLEKMKKLKTDCPTAENVRTDVKQWVKPKMVVEVKYLQRTPHGILRHPDFMIERPDKKPSEVVLQKGQPKPCGL